MKRKDFNSVLIKSAYKSRTQFIQTSWPCKCGILPRGNLPLQLALALQCMVSLNAEKRPKASFHTRDVTSFNATTLKSDALQNSIIS